MCCSYRYSRQIGEKIKAEYFDLKQCLLRQSSHVLNKQNFYRYCRHWANYQRRPRPLIILSGIWRTLHVSRQTTLVDHQQHQCACPDDVFPRTHWRDASVNRWRRRMRSFQIVLDELFKTLLATRESWRHNMAAVTSQPIRHRHYVTDGFPTANNPGLVSVNFNRFNGTRHSRRRHNR